MIVKASYPYDRIGSFTEGNPFMIAFVYHQDESFVLKGGAVHVNRFISRIIKPAVIHYTVWYRGTSRWHVRVINFPNYNIYIHKAHDEHHYLGYYECFGFKMRSNDRVEVARFKRVPRKWIKQLEGLL